MSSRRRPNRFSGVFSPIKHKGSSGELKGSAGFPEGLKCQLEGWIFQDRGVKLPVAAAIRRGRAGGNGGDACSFKADNEVMVVRDSRNVKHNMRMRTGFKKGGR
jgi:hypothetical protein